MEAPRNIVNTAASFLVKENPKNRKEDLAQMRKSIARLLTHHKECMLKGENSILEGLKAKGDDMATEAKLKRDKKKKR